MSAAALALVLAAAVLHAAWNRTLKVTGDRVATLAIAYLLGGLALAPLWLFSAPWRVTPLIVLSALAESAYALCLAAAYFHGALSVAYPLGRGTAPLLVTLGGWIVLAQRPGALAVAGAVALAMGMALVATAGRRLGQGNAVRYALLAGVAIACYSVIDARAVRSVSPPAYLGAVLGLTGLLLAVCAGGYARLRAAVRPGVQIAFGSTGAYLLVLLAFQRAHAGRVSTLREVSVLLGLWFAGERPGRRIWLGAACVVAGIVMAAV